jgi:chemotaxis protein histidine kinase CheA
LPAVELPPRFGEPAEAEEAAYLVVLDPATGRVAMPVQAVVGKTQAVLQALQDPLLRDGPFSGATVLVDGYVSLIVAPYRLVDWMRAAERVGVRFRRC